MAKTRTNNFDAGPEDDSGGHPEQEAIGKFFTGELADEENRKVEQHLAGCDHCRQELATHVRFASVAITDEELQLLETSPRLTIDEQVRQIVRLFPEEPFEPMISRRSVWEWLNDVLVSPALAPVVAVAMVIIVSLAAMQGNKIYQQQRLATELAQGFSALRSEWLVTSEDFRPGSGFESSPFSRPRGATPSADSNAAVQAFRKALQRDPDNREAKLGLAIFYSFSGQLFLADSVLQILLARDATDAEAWNQLGLVRARAGNFEEALAAFASALRHQPRYAEAAFNRALVLTQLGRKLEAAQAWQDYLTLDAESDWAIAARARLAALTRDD